MLKAIDSEKDELLQELDPSRERSTSPGAFRSHSRYRVNHSDETRSLSRLRSRKEGSKWSILKHDPSERLALDGKKEKPKYGNDEDADEESEVSEEELISDSETEFKYDDGGSMLPNFATYKLQDLGEDEPANKVQAATSALDQATVALKSLDIHKEKQLEKDSERIVKEAQEVARLQELKALQTAIMNAVAVHAPISQETMDVIHSLSDKEKKYIDLSVFDRPIDPSSEVPLKASGLPVDITDKYRDYKFQLVAPAEKRKIDAPYTYDSEVKDEISLSKRLNKQITIGEIDSSIENQRCIRTITRGKFFESLSVTKKPNTYLICMDFSPESLYALEWCIGSVLANNSVLFIVYVIEDEKKDKGLVVSDTDLESVRKEGIERLTKTYLDLIKLTRLQIHTVIEVIHHPIPRHLITEVIDHIQPTLVVVGSRGKHALKGVLLGSLSNYLVTKSTVPVMIVRRELKKTLRAKKANNYSTHIGSIEEARVD